MSDSFETARQRLKLQEKLFFRTLERPAMERASALQQWTADDPVMRDEVLAMLRAEEDIQQQIASSAPITTSTGPMRRNIVLHADPAEWIGREVGPFRIEEFLGRGGMGIVFRAARLRGHLQQTVALKIVAESVHASETVRQFESERDLLARMSHPNVARLIDAGVMEGGTPYIAMEFVEGTTFDLVLKDPTVPDTEKLGHFLQLCDAIEYVHDRLILHRDIKPNNVFVTPQGRVKLLDFGIAKLMGAEAGDSAMTLAGLRPLALRYASPERISGRNLSTASDMYSLGAILATYLRGAPPSGAGAKADAPSRAADAVARRPLLPATLLRELEAIAAKALQPEPRDRYASARAFAHDLRAAMESRTTLARRYAPRDRTLLFFRRNRLRFMAAALLLALVLAGTAAVAYQSILVRREVQRNQLALQQEEALIHLLLFDFFDRLKSIPGSTETQRATLTQAVRYLDQLTLSGDARLETGLQDDAVAAYTEFGNLEGSPYEENLGDREGALKTLHKAVALAQSLSDGSPDNLNRREALAVAELALGRVYFGGGDPHQALSHIQHADQEGVRIAGTPGASVAQIAQSAAISDSLGDVYDLQGAANLGDAARARVAYARAEDMDKRGVSKDAACERCLRGIVIEEWKVALTLESDGSSEAMQHLQQALTGLSRIPDGQKSSAKYIRLDNVIRNALGSLEVHMGKNRESLDILSPVHQRFTEALQHDPLDSRARFDRLSMDPEYGLAYEGLGNRATAASIFHEMLDDADHLLRSDASSEALLLGKAQALVLLGGLETTQTGKATASPTLREGLSLERRAADHKDASPESMNLAAETLLKYPDAVPDGLALARSYTERAIAAGGSATAAENRRLAEIDREMQRRRAAEANLHGAPVATVLNKR